MLQNVAYCPTLYTRVAEIKALFHLPAATKDITLPLLIARPWPNARALSRTWEKISEAVGPRRFALDLDPSKRGGGGKYAASAEFDALFDAANGHANYYATVEGIPLAVPVLRVTSGAVPDLSLQIRHVANLDRGLVVRLLYGQVTRPIDVARSVLEVVPDVAFVIDAGWSTDVLGREAWASSIIAGISELEPEAELVVCASSFPDTFSHMGGRALVDVRERELFSRLVRQHNAAQLTYGDWGSTRPPAEEKVPMRNTPRIDLPSDASWICFRKDGSENYPEIARRVIVDQDWPSNLAIWGTYTIECTAQGLAGAIRSPGTAAAARVNIHMHRQANFGTGDLSSDGDEPFTDD